MRMEKVMAGFISAPDKGRSIINKTKYMADMARGAAAYTASSSYCRFKQ
jgi:hypothetical protein